MAEDIENEKKEIEVVTGDGTEIEFSPVYEHLNAVKPKPKDENEKKKNFKVPWSCNSVFNDFGIWCGNSSDCFSRV